MFKFTPNTYHVEGDAAIFDTCNGETFKIDAEDIDKIICHHWGINKKGYVVSTVRSNGERSYLRLHRFITDCPNDMVVDHINHDTADNRKCNLRICTQNDNVRNRKPNRHSQTGIKGVYTEHGKYRAIIGYNCKNINLGTFSDINDAIAARQEAEERLFGNYACLQNIGGELL